MRRALQQKTDLPEATAHSRTLYMMSAGFVGLAVAGAFLSVTYYPHIFVLNGLAIAYRAIVVEKTGVALVVNKPGPKERRLAAIARQSRAQGKTT
jgi:hypothetical protein